MNTVYFVDFDHTISRRDVWDHIVKSSSPTVWKKIILSYLNGDISSKECNLRLADEVQPREPQIRQEVLDIGIDPTFHDFVQFVHNSHNHESPPKMIIVSDGYDYYIDLLLREEGLEYLLYFSNKMIWTEKGIKVEFPWYNKDCERDMANCKCQHLLPYRDKRLVYIGDGISDVCAAQKCDVIYAKRNLLEFCQKNNIPHYPFHHFGDVIEKEHELLQQIRSVESQEDCEPKQ